jgi:hypothetical protein
LRKVPLSGKKAAGRVALVDDDDYDLVMRYKWFIVETRMPNGSMHGPYALAWDTSSGRARGMLMHKLITGYPLTDHKNGSGLDNQRTNLRHATARQNQYNLRPQINKSSRYKGVCWLKDRKVWRAMIRTPDKRLYLGSFAIEEEAARAYDDAARHWHGEFARLNFPEMS